MERPSHKLVHAIFAHKHNSSEKVPLCKCIYIYIVNRLCMYTKSNFCQNRSGSYMHAIIFQCNSTHGSFIQSKCFYPYVTYANVSPRGNVPLSLSQQVTIDTDVKICSRPPAHYYVYQAMRYIRHPLTISTHICVICTLKPCYL
jgi:hypothetical protein